MNAIILCTGSGEWRVGPERGKPDCLLPLAGLPILTYVLASLARLCLTRIVLATSHGGQQIRAFSRSHLPGGLVRFAPCSDRLGPESLAILATALRFVEPTGILIVSGNCIFDTELAGLVAGLDVGLLPYMALAEYGAQDVLLAMERGRAKLIGRGVAPGIAAGKSIGIRYVPRGYLPSLRGVIVELLAAGAAGAHYCEALRTLIERGLEFRAVDASGMLHDEVKQARDIPRATSVALELQRRGGFVKRLAAGVQQPGAAPSPGPPEKQSNSNLDPSPGQRGESENTVPALLLARTAR